MDFKTAVKEACARYTVEASSAGAHGAGGAEWNLTVSHHTRMGLNANLQAAAAIAYKKAGGTALVHIDPDADDDEERMVAKKRAICKNTAQAYDLWPGTRLIGNDSDTKTL